MDVETGERVVWNSENHPELDRAVASSSSVPGLFPPITIDGRRYIDGGLRGTSAGLAAGHDLVVIATVRDPDTPLEEYPRLERARLRIAEDRKALEESGSTVVTVVPDIDAAVAMGTNPHESSRSPAVAEAGFRQGGVEAEGLRRLWS